MITSNLSPEEIRLLFIKKERDMIIMGFNYLDILAIYHPMYYNNGFLPSRLDLFFPSHPKMPNVPLSADLFISSKQPIPDNDLPPITPTTTISSGNTENVINKTTHKNKESIIRNSENQIPINTNDAPSSSPQNDDQMVVDDDETLEEDNEDVRALRQLLALEKKQEERKRKKPKRTTSSTEKSNKASSKQKRVRDSEEVLFIPDSYVPQSKIHTRSSTRHKASQNI
ncbi:hypothetical protein EDI_200280 [Entamoeba dispar SAW760]|uniref:Uncharacterized protein n=1 Tax=Entamoeba dispar (strain ATCC PRA-260 / SAW760) TaxID=370354 RepID=B0EG23_ENTDS|nr:uncharacterized protein EDI_200280 [Entamoeba dispar SAW760]EDR26517.1 hypothetical protein EDI_200280 [Entamoeba dispar SAW760]|eukprot:EDR26517.1 hypothetical protein EDI_200280 [Entamoeba dispar SAW760]